MKSTLILFTILFILSAHIMGCSGADGESAPPSSRADSTAPATAMLDTTSLDTTSVLPVPADAAAVRVDPATRLDTLVALGRPAPGDTVAVAPTAEELAALRTALVIPVDGVEPDDLVDSFTDARGERVHDALDILAPRGTPVRAATAGRLLKLFDSENGGLMVYASDPTGRFVLLYGHLDSYAPGLVDGMPLRQGQLLGTVGTTGNAPPGVPHLHFGIARTRDTSKWWLGMPIDARPLLQRARAGSG